MRRSAGRQGLGEELALVFALHGARLILSARNTERLQARWPHQEPTLTFWLKACTYLKDVNLKWRRLHRMPACFISLPVSAYKRHGAPDSRPGLQV